MPFSACVVCLFSIYLFFPACCINPAAPVVPLPEPGLTADRSPAQQLLRAFFQPILGFCRYFLPPSAGAPNLTSHFFVPPPRPGPLHLPGIPSQGSPQRAVPGCGPLFNWLINSGGAVVARRGSPRRRAAGRCRLPPLYRLPDSPSHILGGGGLNEEALIATEKCPNNFFSG